jgi:ABC-type multidrug transport system fused ATPase/permease subunit
LTAVFADVFTLIILTTGLILLDPLSTVLSTSIFATVSVGMHFSLKNYLIKNSKSRTELLLKNANEVNEVVRTYKEAFVRNTRYHYLEKISITREKLAHSNAQLVFIPNLSKYAMEVTVVFSLLGVCAIQFIFGDAANAVANLAIFLAAGTRIAPAVLRIQQGLTQIRSGLAEAEFTLSFIKEVSRFTPLQTPISHNFDFNYSGFLPHVEVENLTFQFPDESQSIFANLNVEVNQGETLAIFGSSGSGKSTLVDLILGLIAPNSGTVKISGLPPGQAIAKWPGSIAYVPQEIEIISGTILENLTLGFTESIQNEKHAIEAIRIAQLSEFVSELPLGIHTQVGNAGVRLSGGQKQRLGIARACYTQPKLLILDEPTSALDENTSFGFHNALAKLHGTLSIIVIAHKIETARFADRILYLNSNGPILYHDNLAFIRNYNSLSSNSK